MKKPPIISVRNVSKEFTLPDHRAKTVLASLVHGNFIPKREPPKKRVALRDVSLTVEKGQVLALIGANGSGKTTLLRIIAGIMQPNTGSVVVRSKVTSLINLNVSLKSNLTVHDNIYLACTFLGLPRKKTHKKLESILRFADLEDCIDMFPYQMSSGMNQRLAFSIAIHSEPKILLLDEVFSAGDIAFRKRAHKRMSRLISNSVTTVVMSSHNLAEVRRLADTVIWLEKGEIQLVGKPNTVVDAYEAAMVGAA